METKSNILDWVIRLVITTLILCISTLAGCIFGMGYANYLDSPRIVQWRALEPLPEKAVKILAADPDFVFVQTTSGQVYYYSVEKRQWQEVSISSVYQRGDSYLYYSYALPPIPNTAGKIIDEAVGGLGTELRHEAKYVINDRGQVWMWRYSPTKFIAASDGIVPGSFIGFLIGILISVFFFSQFTKK
jgi:hypothetical protein